MTGFLTLEMRRCLRDVRYLLIAVVMPIGLYLLFTGLFGSHGQRAQGLPQPAELMVAMIAYAAMWAVFSATGPRIAQERAIGWTRQLRATPLTPASALAGKLVTALAAALPAMILVALTAVLSHHVRLGAGQWPALLAAMWAGVLPLALLGLAIGYLAGDDIAFPLTMALYFALGALGGLWMPLSVMPHAMQDIAQALPSNGVAELGWRIAGGQASVPKAALVLTAWTLGSGLVALLAYRRRAPGLTSRHSPISSHRAGTLPRQRKDALRCIHALVWGPIRPGAPTKAKYQRPPPVFRRCPACRAPMP